MSNPVCYVELHAHQPQAAVDFYRKLFDWKHTASPTPKGTYHELAPGEGPPAGVTSTEGGAPSRWLVYLQVDDIVAATARAAELGGKVLADDQLVPGSGRYSQIVDPTGATFGLWQPLAGAGKK